MTESPKLLVEWSSPWEEFLSSIGPALQRSPERLAGEAPTGLFPLRGLLGSLFLEALFLAALMVLPGKLARMHSFDPPQHAKYDVIYYSGEELPRTEDLGGAQQGKSGLAGGKQAYHRTQTIRVARGQSLTDKVVDAPKLTLPRSDLPVANLLAIKRVPGPPPAAGLKSSLPSARLPEATVVPPPPEVLRDRMLAAPALNATIVPPAPTTIGLAAARRPEAGVTQVIPPPVSAQVSQSALNARLTLPPPPNVIAPPPGTITRDLASAPTGGLLDPKKDVIPPPPAAQATGGSVFGRALNGLAEALHVVPPPPTISGGTSPAGRGHGTNGGGLGGDLDAGAVLAPPVGAGGNSNENGIVVSSQPGSRVGVPGNGGAGSLAMSPSGGAKPGFGGSGGGTGIGHGTGPGSGLQGEGPGAGKTGTGLGSDPTAKGGISPYPGSGGAGTGTSGHPPLAGVSVQGGNTVNLPSFGSSGNDPNVPGRSSIDANRRGPGITVVATARSGGVFNFYGLLKGDRVYSTYLDTALGTAVLQFADPLSTTQSYSQELSAPVALRVDLPQGLGRSRLVIACVIDRTGKLKNMQVLEGTSPQISARMLAALTNWVLRPVLRGEQPVEVNAILGFNIDTR
jgi:hypothetical protein